MAFPGSWRDCQVCRHIRVLNFENLIKKVKPKIFQAWRSDGIELSTSSNEAAKLYDATLHQLMSLRNDPSLNGVPGTVGKMVEADPNFLMGQVIKASFSVGASRNPSDEVVQNLEELRCLSQSIRSPNWEKSCFEAVEHMIYGYTLSIDESFKVIFCLFLF